MIKAEILYKNGMTENKTFRDSGAYIRFIDARHDDIRIVTADNIRPVQLRQGRCDRKCVVKNAEAKEK